MSGLEPSHHWVIIGLLYNVFEGPLTVYAFEHVEGLVIFLKWIVIIAQVESIIIVSAYFLDANIFCISESYDLWLIAFLVKKEVFGSCESVFL